MKNEMIVREATIHDLADLAEISRTTWEGHDYLEKVSEKWLNQQGFFVGELNNKVIACGKLTKLPGKVAWLEGLRVHNDYKGKGFGKQLAYTLFNKAKTGRNNGIFDKIEFSTYGSNNESISISEKQGFKVNELFHVISLENPPLLDSPVNVVKFEPSLEDLTCYNEHAPCGWKYVLHNKTNALEWLKENAEFWEVESGAKFIVANRDCEVSPLASAIQDPEGFIKGVLAVAEKKRLDYIEMMVHDEHKNILETAVKFGFSYWEEHNKENLLVFRLS